MTPVCLFPRPGWNTRGGLCAALGLSPHGRFQKCPTGSLEKSSARCVSGHSQGLDESLPSPPFPSSSLLLCVSLPSLPGISLPKKRERSYKGYTWRSLFLFQGALVFFSQETPGDTRGQEKALARKELRTLLLLLSWGGKSLLVCPSHKATGQYCYQLTTLVISSTFPLALCPAREGQEGPHLCLGPHRGAALLLQLKAVTLGFEPQDMPRD